MAQALPDLTGRIRIDTSELEGVGGKAKSSLSGLAVAAGAAGVAAGAALTAGLVGAMSVEQGNDKLAAQLGLTATESERIGGVAGSLYANAYGGSLEEVNGAVGAVISSIGGMRTASDADVTSMSAKMLDLAATFEVDVARAAQVAGQAVSSGLATDASQAVDLLVASMQKVPAAVREDLVDAVDEYGPFMASIGITGEQAFGLLASSAEKGMFGIDKTGDALKEFTIRATDMSTASKVGFDAIGLSQEEMSAKILAGGDVAAGAFDQIVTGILGIKDPVEQSQAALALFGTPLEDLSTAEIPKFLGSLVSAETGLGNVAGAADRMGATLNDNAATNLESFKRQISTTFTGFVGGVALPAISALASFLAVQFGPAVQVAVSVAQSFGAAVVSAFGYLQQHAGTIQTIATVLGVVLAPVLLVLAAQFAAMAVAATVSAASTVIAFASKTAAAVAYGAAMYANSVRVIAALVGMAASAVAGAAAHAVAAAGVVAGWVLMGVQSLLAAAKIAAAWLIAMGPIALVVAAVVALAVVIYKNMDAIKAAIGAAWEWVKNATSSAWEWVKSKTSALWDGIKGAVSSATAAVKSGVSSAWEAVKSSTSSAWEAVKRAVSTAIDGVVGFVKGLPGKAVAALSSFGSMLSSAARTAFTLYYTAMTTVWGTVLSFIASIPGKALSALGDLGGLLTGAGRRLMDGLARGIGERIDAVVGKVREAVSLIGRLLPGSPIKDGPLKSWNQGGAGKRLMGMLAGGIAAEAPAVAGALRSALDVPMPDVGAMGRSAVAAATASTRGIGALGSDGASSTATGGRLDASLMEALLAEVAGLRADVQRLPGEHRQMTRTGAF